MFHKFEAIFFVAEFFESISWERPLAGDVSQRLLESVKEHVRRRRSTSRFPICLFPEINDNTPCLRGI